MKKLQVFRVLKSGIALGLANYLSIFAATILYLLTLWIPYINVGTTIALQAIPLELSKGRVISPIFIFKSVYRRRIGEFLILYILSILAMLFGALLGFIPMYVIAIAWSLAFYLFLDRDLDPIQSLRESNRLTYGNKWRIFAVDLILGCVIGLIIIIIDALILKNIISVSTTGNILRIVILSFLSTLIAPFTYGCNAVIYRRLTASEEEEIRELRDTALDTQDMADD